MIPMNYPFKYSNNKCVEEHNPFVYAWKICLPVSFYTYFRGNMIFYYFGIRKFLKLTLKLKNPVRDDVIPLNVPI